MTRREQVLAGCVAGAIVLFGGYQFARWAIVGPLDSLKRSTQDAVNRRAELARLLHSHTEIVEKWQDKTRRTLSADENRARDRFREDIGDLLAKHDLRQSLTVSPLSRVRLQNGLIEWPISIRVTGSLDSLEGFLRDFYERPYFARIRNITITPEEAAFTKRPAPAAAATSGGRAANRRGNRPGRPPAGDKPAASPAPTAAAPPHDYKLSISITATTVVLPKLADIEHRALPDSPEDWPPAQRLTNELEKYDAVAAAYLFDKYVPPPPAPVVVQKPPATTTQATEPVVVVKPPEPVKDPREGADKIFLKSTLSLRGQPVAYIRNDNSAVSELETVHRGEPIDDGTVVLIHPLGMVVRVEHVKADTQTPEGEGESYSVDYFYKLGASFRDRVELDPALHPDIAAEMELVRTN